MLPLVTELPVTLSPRCVEPGLESCDHCVLRGLSLPRCAPHALSRVSPAIDSPARDSSRRPDPVSEEGAPRRVSQTCQ